MVRAQEGMPMRDRQVGDILITRVIESERPDDAAGQFFPGITPERWAPYPQRVAGRALDPTSNALTFPMRYAFPIQYAKA
jgi:hypothetical protein